MTFFKKRNVEFPLERLLKCLNMISMYDYSQSDFVAMGSQTLFLPVGIPRFEYKSIKISHYYDGTIFVRVNIENVYDNNKGFLDNVPHEVKLKVVELINELCDKVETSEEERLEDEANKRKATFEEFLKK